MNNIRFFLKDSHFEIYMSALGQVKLSSKGLIIFKKISLIQTNLHKSFYVILPFV